MITRISCYSKRKEVAILADALGRTSDDEAPVAALWLTGALPQGRIGLEPAAVRDAWPEWTASSSPGSNGLEILEVDAAFGRMAALEGAGSTTERGRLIRALLSPRYPGGVALRFARVKGAGDLKPRPHPPRMVEP